MFEFSKLIRLKFVLTIDCKPWIYLWLCRIQAYNIKNLEFEIKNLHYVLFHNKLYRIFSDIEVEKNLDTKSEGAYILRRILS